MKNNPKNVKTPVIVILYLLAALFLGYGIYMAYDAVVYVNTYDTNAAVSATNMLQYVVAASASYFGFAIVIFAAASIMGAINKVQHNLYSTLSISADTDKDSEDIAETIAESAPIVNAASTPVEKAVVSADENKTSSETVKKAPETDSTLNVDKKSVESSQMSQSEDDGKEHEADSTLNTGEAPAEPPTEIQETSPDAEQEHTAESKPAVQPESEVKDDPEEKTVSLVENFSSHFITEKEKNPVPESTEKPSAPEIIVQQQATPEIVAQQQPTPEIVIKKRPASETIPQKSASQQQAPPETSAAKADARPQPSTVPEEILQTKRKRGLKYETVAMEENKSTGEYPQNLTDTIRLKKEDRDAISSAFIRDIFEKHE